MSDMLNRLLALREWRETRAAAVLERSRQAAAAARASEARVQRSRRNFERLHTQTRAAIHEEMITGTTGGIAMRRITASLAELQSTGSAMAEAAEAAMARSAKLAAEAAQSRDAYRARCSALETARELHRSEQSRQTRDAMRREEDERDDTPRFSRKHDVQRPGEEDAWMAG